MASSSTTIAPTSPVTEPDRLEANARLRVRVYDYWTAADDADWGDECRSPSGDEWPHPGGRAFVINKNGEVVGSGSFGPGVLRLFSDLGPTVTRGHEVLFTYCEYTAIVGPLELVPSEFYRIEFLGGEVSEPLDTQDLLGYIWNIFDRDSEDLRRELLA